VGNLYGTDTLCQMVEVQLTSTGEEKRNMAVRVYPSPASSILNIELPEWKKGQLKLFNLSGQILWQQPVRDGGTYTVDIQSWPAGLYFYSIRTSEGILKQGKFVKE
jgi:hypothetical protein